MISSPRRSFSFGRVVGMHEAHGFRERLVEFGHAARHGAGMPVLQHAAGREPERIFVVGRFCRRFIGQGEDARLAVGEAVELDACALLHIGIETFAETPARFLAVDDGPAQPAHLMIGVERREIVAMAAAERGVFLEQALMDVEAERLRLVVGVAGLDIADIGNLSTWPFLKSTSNSVLPRYSGFFASSSSGQTSSILKRLENSISCQRSDRDFARRATPAGARHGCGVRRCRRRLPSPPTSRWEG